MDKTDLRAATVAASVATFGTIAMLGVTAISAEGGAALSATSLALAGLVQLMTSASSQMKDQEI